MITLIISNLPCSSMIPNKHKKNIRPLSPLLSAQQPFSFRRVGGRSENKQATKTNLWEYLWEETLSMVFQFLNWKLYLSLPICAFHWFFPCLRVSFHMLRLRRYLACVRCFFGKPHWKVNENAVFHVNQNGCNHFAQKLQDYLIIQASAVRGLASSSTMEVSKCQQKKCKFKERNQCKASSDSKKLCTYTP